MKLKLFRKSGMPVNLSDREAYDVAWKAFYDKVAAKAGLDMMKMHRMLRYGERQLVRAFNKEVEVEMPRSTKGLVKLIESYEDTPIMIARTQDGKGVVGILMDEQF